MPVETTLRLRGLVEGEAEAEVIAYAGYLSFYGEVDPETGVAKPIGATVASKLLVIYGTRGSTVGSYVLYALRENGKAPAGIVVAEPEPILVAGAVMADIPLAADIPRNIIDKLASAPRGSCRARLAVSPPDALLQLRCQPRRL